MNFSIIIYSYANHSLYSVFMCVYTQYFLYSQRRFRNQVYTIGVILSICYFEWGLLLYTISVYNMSFFFTFISWIYIYFRYDWIFQMINCFYWRKMEIFRYMNLWLFFVYFYIRFSYKWYCYKFLNDFFSFWLLNRLYNYSFTMNEFSCFSSKKSKYSHI